MPVARLAPSVLHRGKVSLRPKPRVSPLMVIAVLGSLPVTTGACGFVLTRGPPAGHEQMDYFTCTDGNAAPIIDVVAAGLSVLTAITAAVSPYGDGESDTAGPSRGFYVAYFGVLGVALGTSGMVGFNKTKKCRAAKRQLARRQARWPGVEKDQPADVVVQSVVLTPSVDTLAVGERVQMTATAYNSSGASIANKMFVWSSSSDAIASVSSAGLVTANAVGAVVIAARTDNVVGTSNILVVSPR